MLISSFDTQFTDWKKSLTPTQKHQQVSQRITNEEESAGRVSANSVRHGSKVWLNFCKKIRIYCVKEAHNQHDETSLTSQCGGLNLCLKITFI